MLPFPDDPVLARVAEQLEAGRYTAEVWDAEWRLVYMTDDQIISCGAGRPLEDVPLGAQVFSEMALSARDAWPASATTASFNEILIKLAPAIAHDLPGGVDELRTRSRSDLREGLRDVAAARSPEPFGLFTGEIKFGNTTRPFKALLIRLHAPDGCFAGTMVIAFPGLPSAIQFLLGTGDEKTLERTMALVRPARRPSALMFVDLEASSELARRLPTPGFFALVRRLIFRIDEAVVVRGGVVGKHAGDGASAFFIAEMLGGEAEAARCCLQAAFAIRDLTGAVAERSNLEPGEVVLRFGLHWGTRPYVGRLLTGGRTEVTALGEEVNETARIEACAGGGRILASKALLERVSDADATEFGIDLSALRFTALSELPGVTAKAVRDAPSIPVCEL